MTIGICLSLLVIGAVLELHLARRAVLGYEDPEGWHPGVDPIAEGYLKRL